MEEYSLPQKPQENEHIVTTDEILAQHPHTSPVPILPQLSVALGLLVFVFGVTYIGATNVLTNENAASAADVRVETKLTTHEKQVLSLSSIFEDVTLGARGAIVWDVKRQRMLFNKNADEQYPLASITKLMTALVSYELLGSDAKVAITLPALKAEGDSGFADGEEFTIQNLLDLTLIESSNDGASALSQQTGNIIMPSEDPELVFVKAMNIKAEELGLSKTYFKNSTGLDISETQAGAYGSARDVAHLMEYIIMNITDTVEHTSLDATTVTNEEGAFHLAENTNEVVDELEGLIASKTGYTVLSGGNLVVAVNVGLNRPIIVAVLGSSYDGRFTDTLELVKRARLYVENEE